MSYRKFLAERVFDGFAFLPANTVVITDEKGLVLEVLPIEQAGEGLENLQGILSPGLINSHCHLELSHMKGVIPEGTGLIDFLISVVTNRGKEDEGFILQKITEAEEELYRNGIVAVGDISNTVHTFYTKAKGRLKWHTMVEMLNFFDSSLPQRLAHNQTILDQFQQLPYTSALTAHAPYTVNAAAFRAINDASASQIISVHNQETAAEDLLFEKGEGDFLRLYTTLGIGASPHAVSGKSSLQTYLPYFAKGQTIVLVHNTFTSEEDIVFAKEYAKQQDLSLAFCLCPNANLYIEQNLPPVELLLKHDCMLVLGTDSYSSNWQLSIAQEARVIQQHFPHISLQTIMKWASSNGARVFGWDDLGTLRKGTSPGLVLWETHQADNNLLTGNSKRLI